MVDQRVEKLANLCVHYSVNVKPKETVLIQGSELAFPLIHEIYKECLLNDAYPQIIPSLDVKFTFFRYAKEHQLKFVSPFEKFIIENIDVYISIFCQPNSKSLTTIDAAKIRIHSDSRRQIMDTFLRREAEGKLKWTGLPYPINAEAQEAEMALSEYEDFV